MHTTDQITVVLKAREGESIADLAPFLKSGCTVLVGRSGAVVSAVSAGDRITHAEQLKNQVLLAESAMRRGVQLSARVKTLESMHIDDRIRMVANAKRYEWLRDNRRATDFDNDLRVRHQGTVSFGRDLDRNVDDAMRLARLKEPRPCAD